MDPALTDDLRAAIAALSAPANDRTIVVLTGAGISAECGVPTFRGPEGVWTVGSRLYAPEEMATWACFRSMQREFWRWYLGLLSACRAAAPGPAHAALQRLDHALGDRLCLVTQNIDALHVRAGNDPRRVLAIHGDSRFMRCSERCTPGLTAVPADITAPGFDLGTLHCPACGAWMRPHGLFFDEYYEESLYRSDSALAAARRATLLLVVGTSGATSLPNVIADAALGAGAIVVDINPEPNPFAEVAHHAWRTTAGVGVPAVVDVLLADARA